MVARYYIPRWPRKNELASLELSKKFRIQGVRIRPGGVGQKRCACRGASPGSPGGSPGSPDEASCATDPLARIPDARIYSESRGLRESAGPESWLALKIWDLRGFQDPTFPVPQLYASDPPPVIGLTIRHRFDAKFLTERQIDNGPLASPAIPPESRIVPRVKISPGA
jgi:hypothetical protein